MIKRWQRNEIEEVDRRMRQAIDKLREEYEKQIEQGSRD